MLIVFIIEIKHLRMHKFYRMLPGTNTCSSCTVQGCNQIAADYLNTKGLPSKLALCSTSKSEIVPLESKESRINLYEVIECFVPGVGQD